MTLVKGSIASSPRQKRNARKRSFEHSLSATAAKIVKLEREMEDEEEEETAMDLVDCPNGIITHSLKEAVKMD